jgi:uncharacterized protein (DUF2235 family)
MKRIVISCDGTWSRADARRPTNALKLVGAVEPEDADGIEQVVCHLDGVGSGHGTGGLARLIDRTLGGALGAGLMRNVAEAYRFLVLNHAPDDEVYLFGFSRGAYTARTLVGLIRNCGLLGREDIGHLPATIELYQSRDPQDHPNGDRARSFRTRYAKCGPDVWPTLAYLGVWDTVGALGIPKHLWWAARANRGLAFHDTALSAKVRAARHAVAIDERRRTYVPALWDNLVELNAGRGTGPYQQVWFPGNHGAVGGGAASPCLSNDPLHWVAVGAMEQGLCLSGDALSRWSLERDCRAFTGGRCGLLDRMTAMGYCDRTGPRRMEELSHSAFLRWYLEPGWRPGALRSLQDTLAQLPASERVVVEKEPCADVSINKYVE